MNVEKRQICRLCFAVADHKFYEINKILNDILEVLLLEMDWNIIQNPMICQTCTCIIRRSFYFKSTCTRTEKLIASFALNKGETKFDFNDIVHNKRGAKLAAEINFTCRFCMNRIKNNNYVFIEILMEEALYKKMLPVFMPEMDFSIVKNPIICSTCKETLDCYFVFLKNLLDIENKLYMYCQNMSTNRSHGIKPDDILHFLSNSNHREELEKVYSCEPMKTEEIFYIKDEEVLDEDEYSHKQINRFVHSGITSENNMHTCEGSICKTNQSQHYNTNTTDVVLHKCTLCTYTAKYKRSIRQHMLIHKDLSEIDMHKCPDCPYSTKWKAHFKRHVLVHKDASEVEMYKCELCTYTTKFKATLQRHALTHKDASEVETYKCTQCLYETKCKRYLKCHMLVHKDASEVEMYKCGWCNYTTKYNRSLQQHVLIHKDASEVETYKCSHCLYETKCKRYLKSHMLVHKDAAEVKTYKYRLSMSATNQKHTVQQHKSSDKDISDMYKCSICPYETKWKSHLKRHVVSHKDASELEMYMCGICDCQFKHKQNMKRHILTHKDCSEFKIYKCSVCNYQTKYQKNLQKHTYSPP